MKLKRLICVLAAALSVVYICSCSNKNGSKEDEKAFFELSTPPQVLYTEPEGEIVTRYNDKYTTEFTPSAEYGNVTPFIGKYLTYKLTNKDGEHSITAPLYGLCTEDGKIIVDPVYASAERFAIEGGQHFYQLYINPGTAKGNGRYIAVAHDGSWKIDLGKDSIYSGISGDGTIAFERTRVISKTKTNYYYDFYDLNGKKLFTFEPLQNKSDKESSLISNFSDGFAAVNETKTDDKTTTNTGYYIDKKGTKNFSGFTFAGDFENGYAVVADKDGLYGVIDTEGKYLIDPAFSNINYTPSLGLFSCEADDVYTIYNTKKEIIKTIFCKNSDLSVLGVDKLIIEKTSRVTNKSEFLLLENEEPFIYSGTGQFPTEYLGDGLYLCNYSNIGYIFDENGDSVVTCENFGGIVANQGDYIVAQTKHKDKLIFIDVLAKKILCSLEAKYVDGIWDKGIFTVKMGEKYAVYNAASNKTLQADCDFAEISHTANKSYITTVKDGEITVFDTDFKALLKVSSGGAEQ